MDINKDIESLMPSSALIFLCAIRTQTFLRALVPKHFYVPSCPNIFTCPRVQTFLRSLVPKHFYVPSCPNIFTCPLTLILFYVDDRQIFHNDMSYFHSQYMQDYMPYMAVCPRIKTCTIPGDVVCRDQK